MTSCFMKVVITGLVPSNFKYTEIIIYDENNSVLQESEIKLILHIPCLSASDPTRNLL